MRVYEVQPGDSPASIAAQDAMAGCPKCSRDLIAVNPHKPTVTHPNGFVTFRELRAGEKLNLPDKWFDGSMDRLPRSYFSALPYADGVTPGVGAPSYPDDLVAAARQADAAIGDDDYYCASVARVGTPVNAAVHAFKVAWNASQSPPVPINTGNYELPTAEALKLVLGEAFEPCAAHKAAPASQPLPTPQFVPQPQQQLSTGDMVGYGLLAAGAAGGVFYLATRRRRRK